MIPHIIGNLRFGETEQIEFELIHRRTREASDDGFANVRIMRKQCDQEFKRV